MKNILLIVSAFLLFQTAVFAQGAIGFTNMSVSTVLADVATPLPAGTPEKPLTEDELS